MSLNKHFKSHFTVRGGYKGGNASIAAYEGKVYKLSSNENPNGASPLAVKAISDALVDLNRYPDQTDIRLREALELYYEKTVDKDQFICGNSGSEIINLVIKGFISMGDEVIISSPYFVPYKSFSLWAGAAVKDIPLKGANFELDIDGIVSACTERTRIVYLTSPNNPTGRHIPQEDLNSLLDKLPSDIVVLYDEVYWHFVEADDYCRGFELLKSYPNIIAINSFSKAYGLAALRIGYGYMSKEVAAYLRQVCRPFLLPKLNIDAAIAALSDSSFIKMTVDVVLSGKRLLKNEFDKLNLSYLETQANFFFVYPPMDADKFVEELEKRGILIRPLNNFGASGFVRITIGNEEANKALILALQEILS